jgi:hypothetical protein
MKPASSAVRSSSSTRSVAGPEEGSHKFVVSIEAGYGAEEIRRSPLILVNQIPAYAGAYLRLES